MFLLDISFRLVRYSHVFKKFLTIYSKPEIQVVHFVSKPNGGVASARNQGLEIASGKWVLMLDGDDILAPNFFNAVVCRIYYATRVNLRDSTAVWYLAYFTYC